MRYIIREEENQSPQEQAKTRGDVLFYVVFHCHQPMFSNSQWQEGGYPLVLPHELTFIHSMISNQLPLDFRRHRYAKLCHKTARPKALPMFDGAP